MSEPVETVRQFCDLMAERDPGALRSYLADDVVYQNTGMPAAVGIDAVLENLGGQFAMFPDSYEYRMKNMAADGDVVLTERVDMIRAPDGQLHGVPVMGTFVLRNGKISRWTHYFDTALIGRMMTGDDCSALVPSGY